MMGALIGLIAAAGLVVLIQFLDDSIHDPNDITKRWGIPILGLIAHYDHSEKDLPITLAVPRSPVSEAFRTIRTNVQFTSVDHPNNVILITSCTPGDGKTTFSVNLATVIAQSGQSTILIDADLRRPQVHKVIHQLNRMGLSDLFLQSDEESISAIKDTDVDKLKVITSGNLPPNPSELLGSEKMMEILVKLKSRFKSIIIDSPPLLVVTDALSLAARIDGVILVIKPSKTKWTDLSRGIDLLKQVKANLLGIVINDVKVKRTSIYFRNYYYEEATNGKLKRPEKGKNPEKTK